MRTSCLVALLTLFGVSAVAPAQEEAPADLSTALDGVAWIGPGVSLADLRGKTVVIMTYVTWCPNCNEWSPDLFQQTKAAAADQPVVIVAVCTDAPTIPGPQYVAERGLVGMNIVHAYDPNLDDKLGVEDRMLFNAMVIGPDGQLIWKGPSSMQWKQDDGSRDFQLVRKIREVRDRGSYTIVTDDMSTEIRTLLWPMEMGRLIADRDLNRAKRGMSFENRTALDAAVQSFAARQLELINELRAGETPQQMAAFAKADLLSKAFPSTDEGRAARQIVNEFNRDSQFKQEIAARKAYEQLLGRLANQPASRQEAQLSGFAKRFEGTYFARQAAAMLAKEGQERVSPAAEVVAPP
jgi:hypothetical protein